MCFSRRDDLDLQTAITVLETLFLRGGPSLQTVEAALVHHEEISVFLKAAKDALGLV
jgi:hypothetical protein